MNLDEAIAYLERKANRCLQLANVQRSTANGGAIAESHRRTATAIALVLAEVPDSSRHRPR